MKCKEAVKFAKSIEEDMTTALSKSEAGLREASGFLMGWSYALGVIDDLASGRIDPDGVEISVRGAISLTLACEAVPCPENGNEAVDALIKAADGAAESYRDEKDKDDGVLMYLAGFNVGVQTVGGMMDGRLSIDAAKPEDVLAAAKTTSEITSALSGLADLLRSMQ